MKVVEPIKDIQLVKEILSHLKSESYREYMFFLFSLHTGIGTMDMLRLKVGDVKNKDFIRIKKHRIVISNKLKSELKRYCKGSTESEYLFKSRNGDNQPISRSMIYKTIKEIGVNFNLINFGPQSLRKTFTYHTTINLKELNL